MHRDPHNAGWKEWTIAFWSGKLPIVYLMLILVVLTLFFIVETHNTIIFYPSLISVVASYGVFTDEVAHLYPMNQTREIPFKKWVYKCLHGRTHDVYGMVIVIASISVSMRMGIDIVQMIIIPLCIIQIIGFAYYRFYH